MNSEVNDSFDINNPLFIILSANVLTTGGLRRIKWTKILNIRRVHIEAYHQKPDFYGVDLKHC